ncbi:diacylglycerol kinase epsilon-like [Littorina saxatilis]|uniref:diacylglycerol kinase epsilon-like n=1 Tax=Littorina saxatilis TaxID=31220 RepID=UPI0038B56DF7
MPEMESVSYVLVSMLTILAVLVLVTRIYRKYRMRHYEVPVYNFHKGHRFYMVDMFATPTYCNVGHDHIIHGAQCDSCGICVDDHLMKEANNRIPCKPSSTKEEQLKHHWVRGNLPLCSRCAVCKLECESRPELTDLYCCWCRRAAHDDCAAKLDVCDLGKYRQLIVPPSCVELKWVGLRGTRQRHLVVKQVKHPDIEGWTPLIVIGNRKSGNNDGELVLRHFRSLLNTPQVIDVDDIPPENGLEWCHLLPDVSFRVLVCGGDGTIGWVLNAIEKLGLKNPRVCILPLGTGNDLSRVLGWGEGYSGDVEVSEILDNVLNARPVNLDRWTIDIRHTKHFGFARPRKEVVMNNYASLGVDALVTLKFHKHRESCPSFFAHRIINKVRDFHVYECVWIICVPVCSAFFPCLILTCNFQCFLLALMSPQRLPQSGD